MKYLPAALFGALAVIGWLSIGIIGSELSMKGRRQCRRASRENRRRAVESELPRTRLERSRNVLAPLAVY